MDIERKKKDDKFIYIKNKKLVTDLETLERIKKLVIPPGLENNVKIANNPDDKVQCIGFDDKKENNINIIQILLKDNLI